MIICIIKVFELALLQDYTQKFRVQKYFKSEIKYSDFFQESIFIYRIGIPKDRFAGNGGKYIKRKREKSM